MTVVTVVLTLVFLGSFDTLYAQCLVAVGKINNNFILIIASYFVYFCFDEFDELQQFNS